MTGDNLERDIRELLAQGLEKVEIARRLGISRKTLYKHLGRMKDAGTLPAVVENPSVTPGRRPDGRFDANNAGGPGGPSGNKKALVTGEYESIWDEGLSASERVVMRNAWAMPTLEQVNRQLGLLDVRIGRAMKRVAQTRSLLDAGVEMQLIGRVEMLVGKDNNLVSANNTLIHKSEVLERQEKAVDRMLQRRERLLSLKLAVELKLKELTLPGEENRNEMVVRFVSGDG